MVSFFSPPRSTTVQPRPEALTMALRFGESGVEMGEDGRLIAGDRRDLSLCEAEFLCGEKGMGKQVVPTALEIAPEGGWVAP